VVIPPGLNDPLAETAAILAAAAPSATMAGKARTTRSGTARPTALGHRRPLRPAIGRLVSALIVASSRFRVGDLDLAAGHKATANQGYG